MNVSPIGSGSITSPNFSANPTAYPATFTCSNNYALTATPNAAAGYKFDRWGGSYSGNAIPLNVTVSDGAKSVTAYFVMKSKNLSLNAAVDMINSNKDMIVLDVSSVSDYNTSHMLCARNYPWNTGTKQFDGGNASLNPYKNDDILIYDRYGAKSKAASDYLSGQGFTSLYYMTDGLDDWIAAGYETFMAGNYPGGDTNVCTCIPPMAYAGTDKAVNEKTTNIALNGQGWDPDGGAVTYLWTQAQGATVTLSNRNAAQPTFTAPDLTSGNDELVFHLTVTDNEGDKDTDSVTVNVTWANQSPIADAGANQTVSPGAKVTLDGSKSTDSENQSSLIYNWSVSSASGVSAPTLSSVSAIKPTFTAPNKTGWIEFRLTVTDNGGKTADDKVKITLQSMPPSNLTVKPVSSTSMVLGWKDNSTNESGFRIERKAGDCSASGSWTQIATTNSNVATYTNTSLTANTKYSYRVCGYTSTTTAAATTTGYSNCVSATTGLTGTPASPMNLIATAASAVQNKLTWTDKSGNETGFQIWRKAGAGAWALLTTTGLNVKTYTDTHNQSGVSCQYYVKACNAKGCSPASNIAAVPAGPTGLTVTQTTTGKLVVSWTDASANETGFEVWRKVGACNAADTWTKVATLGANVKTFTNTGLTPGQTYSYKVRAYFRSMTPYAYGYSGYSACQAKAAP